MKMLKKLFSLCLVVVLVFCMSANVFAVLTDEDAPTIAAKSDNKDKTTGDDTTVTSTASQTITVGSILFIPEIDVVISKPNSILVNPYKMDYDSSGLRPSLISAPSTIESLSTIDMKVTAVPKAQVVAGSRVEYTTDSQVEGDDKLTKPTVYVAFDMANFANASDISDFSDNGTNVSSVVVTQSNTSAASITLAASDGSTAKIGGFQFTGQSGGPDWGEKDLVLVDVVFGFSPVITAATPTP